MYTLKDYQYNLPDDRIAQIPVRPADKSKLLYCQTDAIQSDKCVLTDTHFFQFPELLSQNDVLFFNDTRVVHARIPLQNVRVVTDKWRETIVESGEIFFLHKYSNYSCEVLVVLLKKTRVGMKIFLNDDVILTVTWLTDSAVMIGCEWITVSELLATYGHIPLPPYITPTEFWEEHYQTMFAKTDWSVAAPTASLHFTPTVMEALKKKGVESHFVTLHVGIWTFRAVIAEDIRDHSIHEEMVILNHQLFTTVAQLKLQNKRIIAVWTTVTRVLETMPYLWLLVSDTINITAEYRLFWDKITGDITQEQANHYIPSCEIGDDGMIVLRTKIFMYPWHTWRLVNSLVTNFHVPWSSLLMLVAAAMWYENMCLAYDHALTHDYRFLSFGDAMWIENIQ